MPRFLDAAAPAIFVAQAIGRIGNYFNQELFGGPTNLPWALQIDAAHRPEGYARFSTFHPTFLYELIWDLALAGALVWLGHHRRVRAPGLFALYVAGYSLGRIGEELLRVDPAHHIFGLRLNFYVAALLCLAGMVWFVRTQRGQFSLRWPTRGAALLLAGGAAALCGCGDAPRASADPRLVSLTQASCGLPVWRNAAPYPAGTAERSGGKSVRRSAASTWNSSIGSRRPRNRHAPRPRSPTPSGSDSRPAARTAEDITIWPPWAAKQIRAAACT